jgi:hypothetical protein
MEREIIEILSSPDEKNVGILPYNDNDSESGKNLFKLN